MTTLEALEALEKLGLPRPFRSIDEEPNESIFICGSCLSRHRVTNQHWIRITCPAGGKIVERPICDQCAYGIAAKIRSEPRLR